MPDKEKKAPNAAPNLEKENAELKDKYLRAAAELENNRKRAATDVENAARTRAIGVAADFLPLIDAIDAAAAHAPNDVGVQTLKKACDNTLAKLGIVRIESVGRPMNPQFHNAIQTDESEMPANTVVRELQAGFMFGQSVLRTAMVAVSAGPAAKGANDANA